MSAAAADMVHLQELAAPPGWTGLLLRQDLPVTNDTQRMRYQAAIAAVLEKVPTPQPVPVEEVLLRFERMRPGVEIPVLQDQARQWQPEFGMGVWLHAEAPSTWTTDEFLDAEPGKLRPVIDRVVRVARDPRAQRSAWDKLLGSGALLRTLATDTAFVPGATDLLQPTITDRSLTSFPFYVPLLRAGELRSPSATYDQPLEDYLPGVFAYLSESVEDGGLLVLLRQPPEAFWKKFGAPPSGIHVLRITSSS